MYRDFSEKAKQTLLGMVADVENEKICDFTDWVGDRWLDFQGWIGTLNIKRYIDNVNEYHKKVIDKNNATTAAIEEIFADVFAADRAYEAVFEDAYATLREMQTFVLELTQTVAPAKGKASLQDMSKLNGLADSIENRLEKQANVKEAKTKDEMVKDAFSGEITLLKLLSEIVDKQNSAVKKRNSRLIEMLNSVDNRYKGAINAKQKILTTEEITLKEKKTTQTKADLALTSSVLSYLKSLYTLHSSKKNGAADIVAESLNFAKASGTMWEGIYKYYDKSLTPWQASRLGKKYQKSVSVVSLVGSIFGFSAETIETVETFMDEDSDNYKKSSAVIKEIVAGADVWQAGVILMKGQKVLTRDFSKYKWGLSATNKAAVKKTTTVVSLIDVFGNALTGGIDKAAEVTSDGFMDMGDTGEIGVHFSVHGLVSIVGHLTFGVSDACGLPDKADEISEQIISVAEEKGTSFVNSHSYSKQYAENAKFLTDIANDENENAIKRIGASVVGGTGMIGAIAVDCTVDGLKWIGNQITSLWR